MEAKETYAIHSESLCKFYNQGRHNEVQAVKELNLRIKIGEIYGLLGENGAGKTTIIKLIMNLIMNGS